ncbi:hypothetical protein EC396_11775 [Lutibacter sp. HS1-25]|uniref:DUF6263 family protein n=1 Tax=Lutibacter sp. HS1-25 TaxID=2485000 RepID=UPI001012C5F4|nr:DUF6263 family protein [Lutibacter sp. HS1-25]RXP52324.1 hypothetical protein EC396_11775 [Lutibacter sp. HS1-25]
MKKINLIKTTVAMLFIFSTAFSQKAIELKYNLNTNDKYNYTTETDQTIKFDANGIEMSMGMLMSMEMTYLITNKTDNDIALDGQIQRVQMSQSIMGMEINYDSNTPDNNDPTVAAISEEFQKILNKSFQIVIDSQGKLNNMDLSNIVENKDISNNFYSGTNFVIYPKNKINVGDSWDEEISTLEKSEMKYNIKYTLLKTENNNATIGVEGIISANKVNDVDINLSGTVNGEMIIDTKTGWLVDSLLNQTLAMEISQGGMVFPATAVGTIKNTSKKI